MKNPFKKKTEAPPIQTRYTMYYSQQFDKVFNSILSQTRTTDTETFLKDLAHHFYEAGKQEGWREVRERVENMKLEAKALEQVTK